MIFSSVQFISNVSANNRKKTISFEIMFGK